MQIGKLEVLNGKKLWYWNFWNTEVNSGYAKTPPTRSFYWLHLLCFEFRWYKT